MTERPARSVRFVRCELEPQSPERCRARVILALDAGRVIEGTAEGEASDVGQLRCAAEAAVAALRQMAGVPEQALALEQVETVEVANMLVVAVVLASRRGDERLSLLGFCRVQSPPDAAALAVLNASNRFLGIG